MSESPNTRKAPAVPRKIEVSPHALDVPDIDSNIGLMHTLFTLEDTRGLKIGEIDGELCLRLDKSTGIDYVELYDMLYQWFQREQKLQAGEITKVQYDQWRYTRYTYPQMEVEQATLHKKEIQRKTLTKVVHNFFV